MLARSLRTGPRLLGRLASPSARLPSVARPLSTAAASSATETFGKRSTPLPTIEDAKRMPRHVSELSGDQLVILSEQGAHLGASRERLRREIMAIDGISYSETTNVLLAVAKESVGQQIMMKAPYQLSIYTALVAGWASLPLVFHFSTATLFNDMFVTADPPDVGDADTWLEVGAWSWSWMEPPLGTISFFLLCIQFAREQRMSIGGKAMTEIMQEKQGENVAAKFPQYDGPALRQYSACIAMIDDSVEILAEHELISSGEQKSP